MYRKSTVVGRYPLDSIPRFSARYSERDIDIVSTPVEGLHMHDFFEVYMNVSGKVSFVVEGQVYEIAPGDIVTTRPNEFHYCLYRENVLHRCHCLWLHVDMQSEFAAAFSSCIGRRHNLLPAQEEQRSQRLQLFQELHNESVAIPQLHRHMTLLRILDLILNQESGPAAVELPMPPGFRQIIDYIDENFRYIEGLKALYRQFGISPTSLNRAFGRYLKTSPARYIENKRLSYAKNCLLQGETVMAAALDSGFSDCSHFIQLFHARFGVTPGKYARQSHPRKE